MVARPFRRGEGAEDPGPLGRRPPPAPRDVARGTAAPSRARPPAVSSPRAAAASGWAGIGRSAGTPGSLGPGLKPGQPLGLIRPDGARVSKPHTLEPAAPLGSSVVWVVNISGPSHCAPPPRRPPQQFKGGWAASPRLSPRAANSPSEC